MISLTIPLQPSLNNMFGNKKHGGGRFTKQHYKDWITRTLVTIANADVRPAKRIKYFTLVIILPEKMRGDGDNRQKAVLDILKKAGIIVDDRYCRGCSWSFSDNVPAGFCVIELTPIEKGEDNGDAMVRPQPRKGQRKASANTGSQPAGRGQNDAGKRIPRRGLLAD